MTAVNVFSRKTKLIHKVSREFVRDGWTVNTPLVETHDLRVQHGELFFLLKCVDESWKLYRDNSIIIDELERDFRRLRAETRSQPIVIFSAEFAGMNFDDYLKRGIYTVTLDELSDITLLSKCGQSTPKDIGERQSILLARSAVYCRFVSRLYAERCEYSAALQWARYEIDNNAHVLPALLNVFRLAMKAECIDLAKETAENMLRAWPTDPQVMQSMENLKIKEGKPEEASVWRGRRAELKAGPTTLAEILATQRDAVATVRCSAASGGSISNKEASGAYLLGWLLRGRRRK